MSRGRQTRRTSREVSSEDRLGRSAGTPAGVKAASPYACNKCPPEWLSERGRRRGGRAGGLKSQVSEASNNSSVRG